METVNNKFVKASFKNSDDLIERLVWAVNNQMGNTLEEYASDITNNGVSGGFCGFIYYDETVKFARKYQPEIIELLEEQAEEIGEDIVSMVSGFGHFRRNPMDAEDRKDLYKFLSGGKCKNDIIPNLMSWFACEEASRFVVDNLEESEETED